MKTIYLKRCNYLERNIILAYFPYDRWIYEKFFKHNLGYWSPILKGFILKDDPSTSKKVHSVFAGEVFVDASALHATTNAPKKVRPPVLPALTQVKKEEISKFKRWMEQQRYSDRTIQTYADCIGCFLRFFHQIETDQLNTQNLVDFNRDYILKFGLSSSYQNQIINAVKLFYIRRGSSEMIISDIERPFRERKLPTILSLKEVENLLNGIVNIKHRTMLMLIYSCGLRRGELLNLCIADIDSDRMIVHIRSGKGKKDRMIPLSERMLIQLRDYYRHYQPNHYLFTGEQGGQYSGTSLQQVLRKAVIRANIKKRVTLHTLRHSYATHLMESGVNLRYIQELLGHNSSRTTEIYTHVSSDTSRRVQSPLDQLNV